MIRTETTHSDASLHAAAIARWDDEGGASTSARDKTGVKAVHARSKRTGEMLAASKDHSGSHQGRENSDWGAAVVSAFCMILGTMDPNEKDQVASPSCV
jgi:hypothetical protein